MATKPNGSSGTNGHAKGVKPPISLAHVVLRTSAPNYAKMVSFYKDFLGAHVVYGNDFLSFLTYDEEHHRIAIAAMPDTISPKVENSSGLQHIAFSYETLDDLALTYTQRKAVGIEPAWCVNHGPTTSMYYRDPDGNMLEIQVENFDTTEEATAFMAGKHFAENPIGTDFDPVEFVERVESGESHDLIKKRVEMGPRGMPAI